MTNNQPPRTIAPDEVQVGDRIRIERASDGIAYTETLTVARIKGWKLLSPEGGSAYIIKATETVTLLDRPEPEPDWVADGICVDKDGEPWTLYRGKWHHPEVHDWPIPPERYGPISRHPAVIAAEKRGEQRVIDAANAAMDKAHDAAMQVGATNGTQHAAALQAVQRLLNGWPS